MNAKTGKYLSNVTKRSFLAVYTSTLSWHQIMQVFDRIAKNWAYTDFRTNYSFKSECAKTINLNTHGALAPKAMMGITHGIMKMALSMAEGQFILQYGQKLDAYINLKKFMDLAWLFRTINSCKFINWR